MPQPDLAGHPRTGGRQPRDDAGVGVADLEYSGYDRIAGQGRLVTGGSRGIGRAIVERLAADGAAVAFSYLNSADAANEIVAAITAGGGTAHAIQADLGDTAAAAGCSRRLRSCSARWTSW